MPGSHDLGWALGTLLREYLKHASEAVADLPGGPRGYQVLAIASRVDSPNQAMIAERLGVDRTIMTHLLDDLEAEGLVTRQPDPTDRRARTVSLTPRGDELLAELSTKVAQVERQILTELTPAEAHQLRVLLHRAVRLTDTDHDETACEVAQTIELEEPSTLTGR